MIAMRHVLLILAFFVQLMSHAAEDDGWTISVSDTTGYTGICLANGGIGMLPGKEPLSVDRVILNHVFEQGSKGNVSRVMQGVNPFVLSMQVDGVPVCLENISGWEQTLDLSKAVLVTAFTVPGKVEVRCEMSALRNLAYAGLITVKVKALRKTDLCFTARTDIPADYAQHETLLRTVWGEGGRKDILRTEAVSAGGSQKVVAASCFIADNAVWDYSKNEAAETASITTALGKGQDAELSLAGAVCSSRDFSDPGNEAERLAIYMKHEGRDELMQRHRSLWQELWQGDIIVEGDDYAQRAIRLALFNLYSSCRKGSRLSIPPMGLSSTGYNGHIFWDSEMWMFPVMNLLNADIARSMLDYRFDRLEAARKKAAAYGYDGAMFPWESDDKGEEATPTFALTGPFEHHITADIAIAEYDYFRVSADTAWLREEGYEMIEAAARFIESRVSKNDDGTYSIRNVTGADEYANGVTDNAFTNGSAKCALRFAVKAAEICGLEPPHEWTAIADSIRILTFDDGTLREYEGYDGQMIKQCDANLLGFPLGIRTDKTLLEQDLTYYENKIDTVNGPAMSYSIFAVQYARMGNGGKAYDMFIRSFRPHERPPFGALAETPSSDNPYFMTGAGGLLQAVLYGFGGLEVTDCGVERVESALPPHWKKLVIKGAGRERKTYSISH